VFAVPRDHDAAGDEAITKLAFDAGRGDRAALAEWVRATQRDVWRFVAHLAGTAVADDLTQETYLRAMGSLHRFAGRSSSRTWLLSIARRVVVDQLRTASVRPRLADTPDWQHAVESPERAVRGFEDIVELRVLLDALDPERREALLLTQVLGLSYGEAAEVCGCPVGTIRSRVFRAREDLLAFGREQDNAM
jgi:RNA polymerase sigma-70 factor, ECF subfamily